MLMNSINCFVVAMISKLFSVPRNQECQPYYISKVGHSLTLNFRVKISCIILTIYLDLQKRWSTGYSSN